MSAINVEEIMEIIRKDIKDKGYTNDMLSFKDMSYREFDNDEFELAMMNINTRHSIPWIRPLGGGPGALIKKIIRKMIGFVIAPMSGEQALYNRCVSDGFTQVAAYIEENRKEINKLNREIERLNKKIETLEANNK